MGIVHIHKSRETIHINYYFTGNNVDSSPNSIQQPYQIARKTPKKDFILPPSPNHTLTGATRCT